jgi:uncharacterized protein YndB with AHSA1/START domain
MSQEKDGIVRVHHRFGAAPERVFEAWVDPAAIRAWMTTPGGACTGVVIDARPGGTFRFTAMRGGQAVDHVGEYRAFERPRRLAFTWVLPAFSTDETRVTIELRPEANGTELALTHEPVPVDMVERTARGWTTILGVIERTLGGAQSPAM